MSNENPANFPPLEATCGECRGRGGQYVEPDEPYQCEGCNSTGIVPTEYGRALLKFVASRLSVAPLSIRLSDE